MPDGQLEIKDRNSEVSAGVRNMAAISLELIFEPWKNQDLLEGE